MTFAGFERFCTDFDLFPDVLSKAKLRSYFNTLAQYFQAENSTQGKELMLDEHLFVEALALAAFEIVYRDPQPDAFEKIILLVEKMNQSEGPAKV